MVLVSYVVTKLQQVLQSLFILQGTVDIQSFLKDYSNIFHKNIGCYNVLDNNLFQYIRP